MTLLRRLYCRFPWLNLSLTALVALLQRTPVLRLVATAESMVVGSPVGQVLRSTVAAAATLGALHTLAGATQLTTTVTSPVSAKLGTPIPTIAMTVTGAQTQPGSFRVTGTIPPGLNLSGLTGEGGAVNGSTMLLTGTPTSVGLYTITIRAWEFANQGGDSSDYFPYTITVANAPQVSPAITRQPVNQQAAVGDSVTLSVTVTGSPTPTFKWRRNGFDITGATDATLTIDNVQLGDAGSYTVVATNSAGTITSDSAILTVSAVASGPPKFTIQPVAQTIELGGTVVFSAEATGGAITYRWQRNGFAVANGTSATLVLHDVTAIAAGGYTVIATNSAGSTTSSSATLTVGNYPATDVSRLVNLSVLTDAGAGANVLTVGAVIGPLNFSGTLPLVVRAVGPTLGLASPVGFGLTGVLADPVLTINAAGSSSPITTNDNWGGSFSMAAAFSAVGAFALPTASLDSAALPNVTPGGYTVQVTGKGDASGQVIAEIYDASTVRTAASPRLINLSTLTQIDVGATLAVGFVIRGSTSKTVLVRGIGPTLGTVFGLSGVMADPKLELFDNDTGVKIADNDNWGGDSQLRDAAASVGAFGLADTATKDAVLLVSLPPGAYSARVSGVGTSTGTAIVEVYEVP